MHRIFLIRMIAQRNPGNQPLLRVPRPATNIQPDLETLIVRPQLSHITR